MKGGGVRQDHELALPLPRKEHVVVRVELLDARRVDAHRLFELQHEIHRALAVVEVIQIPGEIRVLRQVGFVGGGPADAAGIGVFHDAHMILYVAAFGSDGLHSMKVGG